MNVQQLCDLLQERIRSELDRIQTGTSTTVPIPDDVVTDAFLKDNVADVFTTLERQDSLMAELIGHLEINAFLSAFQRAYEHQHLTRMQRWAQIYNQKKDMVADKNWLHRQMRNIGVKVDDEFLIRMEEVENVV